MTGKTKHRILGLLVIACLIVIAVPLFHSNKSTTMENPLKEIPPFPNQSDHVQSSVNEQPPVQAADRVEEAKIENIITSDNAGELVLPLSGWVVQLGSFKNKTNALRLVNQLRADGYHAFFNSNHETLTRVFIGPEKNKTDASVLANQVNKKTHLQGIIINYKSLTL